MFHRPAQTTMKLKKLQARVVLHVTITTIIANNLLQLTLARREMKITRTTFDELSRGRRSRQPLAEEPMRVNRFSESY